MEIFLKAVSAVMITVVLTLALGKQGREMAGLLVIIVCCMVVALAMEFWSPVADFLEKLETLGNLSGDMVSTLFKIAGIGILTEVAALVCSDAGTASLGKTLQLLGSAVILWLSIPMFTSLLDLIQKILGGL